MRAEERGPQLPSRGRHRPTVAAILKGENAKVTRILGLGNGENGLGSLLPPEERNQDLSQHTHTLKAGAQFPLIKQYECS